MEDQTKLFFWNNQNLFSNNYLVTNGKRGDVANLSNLK
jgi:hypothetical protein